MEIPKSQCLRCGSEMNSLGTEMIQLGKAGYFTGTWRNILSGALEVEIYICSNCGKVEFYTCDAQNKENEFPQVKCPNCGQYHDFDYPKCPFCNYKE